MKYIFLSLLILIIFDGKSQAIKHDDTLYIPPQHKQPLITGSVTPILSINYDPIQNTYGKETFNPQSDTVKVIMLICDTSVTRNLNVYNPLNIYPDYHNNLCFWQYGYEVWDKEFTQPFIFLDEYKKSLSKNIIVWQTKSL